MMEWNPESVLDALNDFERKPEINPILDEYLLRIAKNGEIIFPWNKLKPLLKKKLEVVLDEFYETFPVETSVPVPNFETFNFDNLKRSILQAVDAFTSAPFTIQRLCELVTIPQKHYNRTDKYMRGIEKNVLVVSTIEPRTGGQGDVNSSNNNVIVNGLINDSPREECDTLNGHESESSDSVSSSNADPPSNHVLLENFANVFPSAACIPSASNICMKRDIDSNFISTSAECEENQGEEEFETTPADQSPEDSDKPKDDEPMDTSEEASISSDDSKMSTEEISESSDAGDSGDNDADIDGVPEKKPKLELQDEQETPDSKEDDKSSSSTEESSDQNKVESESEVQSSETLEEDSASTPEADPPPSSTETLTKVEEPVQQDDTISQSDTSAGENDDKSETDVDKTAEMKVPESKCSVDDKSDAESEIKTETEPSE